MKIEAVEKFLRRFNQCVQAGSREMTIPMPQAAELVGAINELLLKNVQLNDRLSGAVPPQNAIATGTIVIDGGRIGS
jgi:hypothetical protein